MRRVEHYDKNQKDDTDNMVNKQKLAKILLTFVW